MKSRIKGILLLIVFILLIPLIAMQFTDEVSWTITDFAVAAIILLTTGAFIEVTLRKVKAIDKRIVMIGAILVVLVLLWAELAVGIFGSPFAGN